MKLAILILYFAVLIGIGLYCRKHTTDVNGFVLGGRSVGPWLTAFAYGTSYFSSVVFVGYAGQFGWKYGILAGVIHVNIVTNIGYLHGGLNLYNNGLAGGFVAMILIPLITTFKKEI